MIYKLQVIIFLSNYICKIFVNIYVNNFLIMTKEFQLTLINNDKTINNILLKQSSISLYNKVLI